MEKIAKIDVDDYFKSGDANLLESQGDVKELLLRLAVIVNSIADRVNDDTLDRIMKRTEEMVTKLENIATGNMQRGPGG